MRIVIVGAGVSGLTCGIAALDRGHAVTIVARDISPTNTSDIAAAFWYPYHAGPKNRVAAWGAVTYRRLVELAADPETGVVARSIVHRYAGEAPLPWWNGPVEDFRSLDDSDCFAEWTDGYRYRTYLADTSRYMPWLAGRFDAAGGRLERGTVATLGAFRDEADVVINCSGVAARQLALDPSVFPIRGQVVRARKPGGLRNEIRESDCCYVVPRHDDLILGGTAQADDWSRDPREDDTAGILRRCGELCRELDVSALDIIDVKAGLRPGRAAVRLEIEHRDDVPVVHDYGHAGAGFTLSWGCAEEAVALAESVMDDGAGDRSARAGAGGDLLLAEGTG